MPESYQSLCTGVACFLSTIAIATLGHLYFGWTTLESIYMVVMTIFRVGYGEVKPLETADQKIFTMLGIIAGTTSAVYIVGGFVQMITEGEIRRALNKQQQQRTIANLQNHAIICGFGRWDRRSPSSFTPRRCPSRSSNTTPSASNSPAKTLATVLSDDATNVFVTLTARELSTQLTILARGEVPETEHKLRLAAADRVILPLSVGTLQIANSMLELNRRDFINQPGERNYLNDLLTSIDVRMDELLVQGGSLALGRTIMEMEVRSKGAFIAIALRCADGSTIVRPHPRKFCKRATR